MYNIPLYQTVGSNDRLAMLANRVSVTTLPHATTVGKGIKEFARSQVDPYGLRLDEWESQGIPIVESNKMFIPEVMCDDTFAYRAFQIFLDNKLYLKTGDIEIGVPCFSEALIMMHTFDESMNQKHVKKIRV